MPIQVQKFKKAQFRIAMLIQIHIYICVWTLRKVDQKYLESFEMWC
jgi:hypothetical protein